MDYPILAASQVSQQLRALRKARGLSQAELGKRLGLSQSRIARMERAPTQISVDALLQMLAVLKVRMVLSDNAAPPAGPADASQASAKPSTPSQGDW
jgi:HTH-type transcriptional regulator/antitoxin HipB